MKILLLSDSHNDTIRLEEVLGTCGKIDMIIHCGDIERDFELLTYLAPPSLPMLAVAGNNESYAEQPYHRVLELEGIRFYVTHGYLERVKTGFYGLLRKAKEYDCQVILFGHTHQRCDETIDGVRFINPGALCYPGCSYGILSIADKQVNIEFFNV